MKRISLRYLLLTSRYDQIWFPLAFWALFIILNFVRGQQYVLDNTRSYLGAVIPLVGGIMSAYAVLEDPAIELRFATPIRTLQTLLERLLPVLVIQMLCAVTYQLVALAYGADFSTYYPNWIDVQLAWLIPTVSLSALGCFISLAAAHSTTGALLTGMIWLVQLVARSWFAGGRVGQYFLVFMSPLMVEHPALRANQSALTSLSLVLIFASWMLLRRQERYI